MPTRTQGGRPLIAREAEVALVRSWLDEHRVVLVRGEPGIGKSSVLGAALVDRPSTVVARGVRALGEISYLPIRAVLPSLDLLATPAQVAEEVASTLDDDAVLAVDDLHWCDADTLALLGELAQRRPVIGVVRPDPGRAADAVALFEQIGEVLELGPLDDLAARALVMGLRPGAPPSDVEEALRQSRGNPLDLTLFASGDELGPQPGVAVELAIADLRPSDLLVLARLAASGQPADLDDRQADRLVARGVVGVDEHGRCTPRHDLVAEAALAAVGADARRTLHAELAAEAPDAATRAVHFAAADDHDAAASAAREAAAAATTIASRAVFLQLEAEHTLPPDPTVTLAAADALSRAGRYDTSLDLLAELAPEGVFAELALIRARAFWALTDAGATKVAIEEGLGAPDLTPPLAAELLAVRSRLRGRIEWDLDGAVADAEEALQLGEGAGDAEVSARSALGRAQLMLGDPGWQDELERAAELAAQQGNVHEAAALGDALIWGHLFAGDPTQCARVAGSLIGLTAEVATGWNRYFRAASLLARAHVQGDHESVRKEGERLLRQPLTDRTRDFLSAAMVFALLDGGRELDAVELAEQAWTQTWRRPREDTARATAAWVLTEAHWLAGNPQRAFEVADEASTLVIPGYVGVVGAATMGAWAARSLGRVPAASTAPRLVTQFPNLRGATLEGEALLQDDPAVASRTFEEAAEAFAGVSARSWLRVRWAAADAAADAGDLDRSVCLARAVEADADRFRIPWFDRRLDALFRRLDIRRSRARSGAPTRRTADLVMERVARGQPSAAIARSLLVSTATVESHIKTAMHRTGARTRVQAAALSAIAASPATAAGIVVERDPDGGGVRIRRGVQDDRGGRPNLRALPASPWWMGPERTVRGAVLDEVDLTNTVFAIVRGASVDVDVPPASSGLVASLVDALGRLGLDLTVEERVAPVELDQEDLRLLHLLGDGSSIDEAARELGYSRRTVQRRLESARERLGVATNREAVARVVGSTRSPREAGG